MSDFVGNLDTVWVLPIANAVLVLVEVDIFFDSIVTLFYFAKDVAVGARWPFPAGFFAYRPRKTKLRFEAVLASSFAFCAKILVFPTC